MVHRKSVRYLLVVALALVALTVVSGAVAASDGGGHLGNDTHVVCPSGDGGHGDGGGGPPGRAGGPLNAPGNCEYNDIQRAVDAASDGDLVYLQSGTYHQHVVVNDTSNLTIAGAGRNSTLLVGPKATHHEHGENGTNETAPSSYPSNPFTNTGAWARYVVNYPVEWAEAHANDPYDKASMHYDQARNYTGAPAPALHEQEEDGHGQ